MAHSQVSSADKSSARRVVGLIDKTIAGPVASLMVAQTFGLGSSGSMLSRQKSGRLSDNGTQRTRFCTTKTEDAMDGGCMIPCALEEWFRPVLQNNKFGNPDKLKFRYSAH